MTARGARGTHSDIFFVPQSSQRAGKSVPGPGTRTVGGGVLEQIGLCGQEQIWNAAVGE